MSGRLGTLDCPDPRRAATTRTFAFHRDQHGAWTINAALHQPGRILARPRLGTVEIWRFVTDADHAHLSRECLRLTGLPPRAFLGDIAGRCACGHDHSASYTPILRARRRPSAV
jgi:hypothetical protein